MPNETAPRLSLALLPYPSEVQTARPIAAALGRHPRRLKRFSSKRSKFMPTSLPQSLYRSHSGVNAIQLGIYPDDSHKNPTPLTVEKRVICVAHNARFPRSFDKNWDPLDGESSMGRHAYDWLHEQRNS